MSRAWRADAALRPQPRRAGPDDWPTPACLSAALIRDVLPTLPQGTIWEPAAGSGALASALKTIGRSVVASDLADGRNFLTDPPPAERFAAIVTNPPFYRLDDFTRRGLALLDCGCAQALVLLFRWDHMPARCRAPMWKHAHTIHVTTWRPRWIADSSVSPRWHFAWVVWRAGCAGPPHLVSCDRDAPSPNGPLL